MWKNNKKNDDWKKKEKRESDGTKKSTHQMKRLSWIKNQKQKELSNWAGKKRNVNGILK